MNEIQSLVDKLSFAANDFSILYFVSNILLVIILSLGLSIHYQKLGRTTGNRSSLAFTFPFIAVTILLVITVVKSSLALSLGLVGALSIVRFRTAVKDPLDVVYMFWAISIGIANGVAFYSISITGTIFIALLLFLANSYKSNSTSYLLIVHQSPNSYTDLTDILKKNVKKYRVRSRISKKDGDEATIEIKISPNNVDTLLQELKTKETINDATVVEYSQELSGT